MAPGSKICPNCGALNSKDAEQCARCEKPFPSALRATAGSLWQDLLGDDFPVTKLLLILHMMAYAGMVFTGAGFEFLPEGMLPSLVLRWGGMVPGVNDQEPWRIISATFLHFGALHLIMNMFALVHFGKVMEPRVRSARLGVAFVVSTVAGFGMSYVWQEHLGGARAPTGGASAGVFGLVGTYLGYLVARRDSEWKQIAIQVAFYAVVIALLVRVNHAAHLGGFLAGGALGYLYYMESRPQRLDRLFSVLNAILVLSMVGSLFLCQTSERWQIQRRYELQRQF